MLINYLRARRSWLLVAVTFGPSRSGR